MRANVQTLSSLGMFTSKIDKINALVEATSRAEVIPSLVAFDKINHPTLANQTFQGLIAFITLQLPNAAARATSYASSLVPTDTDRVIELEKALARANEIIERTQQPVNPTLAHSNSPLDNLVEDAGPQ